MKDAVTLDVTRTPMFFVNGKDLKTLGYEELRTMVSQALRESYASPGAEK